MGGSLTDNSVTSSQTDVWSSPDLGVSWTRITALAVPLRNLFVTGGPYTGTVTAGSIGGVTWVINSNLEVWQSTDCIQWTLVYKWSAFTAQIASWKSALTIVNGRLLLLTTQQQWTLCEASVKSVEIFDQTGQSLPLWPPFEWSIRNYSLTPYTDTTGLAFLVNFRFGELRATCNDGLVSAPFVNNSISPVLSCAYVLSTSNGSSIATLYAPDAIFTFSVLLTAMSQINIAVDSAFSSGCESAAWIAPQFTWNQFAYDYVPPIECSGFPSRINISVGFVFGQASVRWAGSTEYPLFSQTPFSLPLPSTPWNSSDPLVLQITTLNGIYNISVHNPCGFLPGDLFSPGSRCPSFSACIPVGFYGWTCTPSFVPMTLALLNSSTA